MQRDDAVYFLLVYSLDKQQLVDQQSFDDRTAAITAYDEAEQSHLGRLAQLEIVLIGADSIDTVMKTHGHYFQASSDEFLVL